ncbi:unnamed protein product [Didymodactylos carnosus]|uniref:Uncharacterized protein n=1 Tax=Didymodactylos carnosus TaxID=1234261 RepID=A0A815E573_9BILA|nr:unnamed protein product [Didymodactylos carnosus]CAF4147092.1 unnamed protein product [Didymodactylos carnosus]
MNSNEHNLINSPPISKLYHPQSPHLNTVLENHLFSPSTMTKSSCADFYREQQQQVKCETLKNDVSEQN